jgi:hypothetical protein
MMAKSTTSQSTKAPFSGYVHDFEEHIKKLQFADSSSEVSQLLHDINVIMADYFKAMMTLCEEQHQQLFALAEENRSTYSEKAKNAFDQTETAVANYLQQAREMNQTYWDKTKEPLKVNPQEFIQQTLNDIQKNVSTQMQAWQEMSETKSKEWVAEIENLQDKTSQMLKIAEQNHQELLAQYRELETRLKTALAKKGTSRSS